MVWMVYIEVRLENTAAEKNIGMVNFLAKMEYMWVKMEYIVKME